MSDIDRQAIRVAASNAYATRMEQDAEAVAEGSLDDGDTWDGSDLGPLLDALDAAEDDRDCWKARAERAETDADRLDRVLGNAGYWDPSIKAARDAHEAAVAARGGQ